MADNYLCFSAWVVPEGLLWSFCFHCSSIWHTLYSSTVWAHFWGLSISMWMCSVRHSVYGNALKLPPEKLWAPSSLLLSSSLLYIHLYRQLYVWGISAADSLGWPRDKNHPKRPPPHNVIKGQFWGQDNWPIHPPHVGFPVWHEFILAFVILPVYVSVFSGYCSISIIFVMQFPFIAGLIESQNPLLQFAFLF